MSFLAVVDGFVLFYAMGCTERTIRYRIRTCAFYYHPVPRRDFLNNNFEMGNLDAQCHVTSALQSAPLASIALSMHSDVLAWGTTAGIESLGK